MLVMSSGTDLAVAARLSTILKRSEHKRSTRITDAALAIFNSEHLRATRLNSFE